MNNLYLLMCLCKIKLDIYDSIDYDPDVEDVLISKEYIIRNEEFPLYTITEKGEKALAIINDWLAVG